MRRFDVMTCGEMEPAAEGEWVKAVDLLTAIEFLQRVHDSCEALLYFADFNEKIASFLEEMKREQ